MILFFAGNRSPDVEDIQEIISQQDKHWGVLLSFNDIKKQKGKEDTNKRFENLKKIKRLK